MLNLTRKTDYALVALAYLAQRRCQEASPASARLIAQRFHLPLALLTNIMKALASAKIVTSTRGSQGGYALAYEPDQVTLLQVITATEGPMQFAQCVNGLPVMGQGCPIEEDCPIRLPIRRLHQRLNGYLEQTTLADLQDDTDPTNSPQPAVTLSTAI